MSEPGTGRGPQERKLLLGRDRLADTLLPRVGVGMGEVASGSEWIWAGRSSSSSARAGWVAMALSSGCPLVIAAAARSAFPQVLSVVLVK